MAGRTECPTTDVGPTLEREPHAELHRPRRSGERADAHEIRIREARHRVPELRVVEHVLRFHPEFQLLAANRERAEE